MQFLNSPFNRILLLWISALIAVSTISIFVSVQYFQINPFDSIYFLGTDGWCPPNLAGAVGSHCFGDFGLMLKLVSGPDPWSDSHDVYTASGNLLFMPFLAIYKISGSYVLSLALYLIAILVCLAFPAIVFTRRAKISIRIVVTLISLATFPALFAFDRGNSVAFALPALTMFLVYVRERELLGAAICVVLLSLVKPQFVVLLFALVIWKRYRLFFQALGFALIANLLAYAAWPASFPKNIMESISNTSGYQNYQDLAAGWPTNISLVRPFFWLEYIVHRTLGINSVGADFKNYFTASHSTLIGAFLAILTLALLWWNSNRITGVQVAFCLTTLACLVPSVTFSYYLIFVLAAAGLIIFESRTDDRKSAFYESRGQMLWLAFAIAVSLVKVPLPVVYGSNADGAILLTSGELVPAAFMVYFCLVLFGSNKKSKRFLEPRSGRYRGGFDEMD